MYQKKVHDYLGSVHHGPRKNLGQNFLIDGNILRMAVSWAQIQRGECVIEIGPGLGFLTQELLKCGGHVYAVEIDRELFEELKKAFFPLWSEQLHLFMGDAVKFPRASWDEQHLLLEQLSPFGNFKIVANLPYAISTPWMQKILQGPIPISMTLLLQKEAAQRFTANDGSKCVGAISIALQSAFHLCHSHGVSPSCFYPKPNVNSTLVHFQRRSDAFLFSEPTYGMLRRLFNHRRKQLRGMIVQWEKDGEKKFLMEWLSSLQNPLCRVEDVSLEDWQRLQREYVPISPKN
jgi:16S rRNA (adenine1518-N6/adenine1519-N6)-dimethyltransferase